MSYATPTDLLKRYDARVCGDVCSDSGSRLSQADIAGDTNVQTALDDASGLINTYTLIGNRYTIEELTNLTDVDQATLIRLCCDLAFAYLVQRRGLDVNNYPQLQIAYESLARLRDGGTIFNVAADVEKGQVTASFPSISQVYNLNLAVTAATPRFFGAYRPQSTQP